METENDCPRIKVSNTSGPKEKRQGGSKAGGRYMTFQGEEMGPAKIAEADFTPASPLTWGSSSKLEKEDRTVGQVLGIISAKGRGIKKIRVEYRAGRLGKEGERHLKSIRVKPV